ncbi:MAG TPA: cytochrome b/b6 domain-containing protein [Gammaproteobacteria bacterium]|nr:cytochrome b/b6 domain-containing protein [Gammaproteobacteria bacterium]
MPPQNSNPSTVKAWDPLIRVFHWSLALCFLVTYVTEDDGMTLHIWAGYAAAILIGFRLLWGLIGTRNARFLSFVKSPQRVKQHLRDMLSLRPAHYLGHNPVAAVMVIALLVSIALAAFTGMMLIASDGQGPLAGTMFASFGGDAVKGIHEFFANFTLLLVLIHVGGVIVSSLLEGENLAKAMITGRKRAREQWADVDPAREAD